MRPPRFQEWPKELQGKVAWEPTDFVSEKSYTLCLTEDDVQEIYAALSDFKNHGLYGSDVCPSNFVLPTLGPRLSLASLSVHVGAGFVVVRGLDPRSLSAEDNVLVFLGLSSYIGDVRGRQDENGNMLAHISDAKSSKTSQSERPTRYSNRASSFHTDTFCDILALYTRACAAKGGRNILASSWTIYNKMAKLRPDLVELLAQPIWPFDSRGKFFDSSTRPLLFYHGGRMILNFAREPLVGLQNVRRDPRLACISPLQREALDMIEKLAQESQVMLKAHPGDMLFINNHAVLHSREAFVDSSETPRHLIRLWLKHSSLAWKLPPALQEGNSRIYEDNELGERWNIVDIPRVRFQLSERLTS